MDRTVEQALAGQRTALNLAGTDTGDLCARDDARASGHVQSDPESGCEAVAAGVR